MIAILVFAIVFCFGWLESVRTRSLSLTPNTHSLTLTLWDGCTVGFDGCCCCCGCCRCSIVVLQKRQNTLNMFHIFSNRFSSFVSSSHADTFGFNNDDDDGSDDGDSNTTTTSSTSGGSINIISVPFYILFWSRSLNTPHRCVLHKF